MGVLAAKKKKVLLLAAIFTRSGDKFTETRGLSQRGKLGAGFKGENRCVFAEEWLFVADKITVNRA